MSWPEIRTVKAENRYELILSGGEISERIEKNGLDPSLFELSSLNYLNIHSTSLEVIPDRIAKLKNLQTLVLHSNKLEKIPLEISLLDKLKVLDLSNNSIGQLPETLANLSQLATVNLSCNKLEKFPTLEKCNKLSILDLSNNKLLEFPGVCYSTMLNLSDLKLKGNCITAIPPEISKLPSLKILDVSSNQIGALPGELAECGKLKELFVGGNPITDKRLLKLIEQCRTKQVLDYVKLTYGVTSNKKSKKKGAEKGGTRTVSTSEPEKALNTITVKHSAEDFKIIIMDKVKEIRPFILACVVLNVKLDAETLRNFIQLQTKLHDNVCEKRNAATIATHDFKLLGSESLTYTAANPKELMIRPLNRTTNMSGAELFIKLQTEADNLRKEKKRNVYSGIHKYLYLLEGKSLYPSLLKSTGEVISFPPITNSDISKISLDTTSLLLEVTSSASQNICRKVLDTLLKEMLPLFGNELVVQQVRVVDPEGNFKSIYPARNDLGFEGNTISVVYE